MLSLTVYQILIPVNVPTSSVMTDHLVSHLFYSLVFFIFLSLAILVEVLTIIIKNFISLIIKRIYHIFIYLFKSPLFDVLVNIFCLFWGVVCLILIHYFKFLKKKYFFIKNQLMIFNY